MLFHHNEYIDSMMIKLPCGKGGVITEFPSGKENTYKLADCTFFDNRFCYTSGAPKYNRVTLNKEYKYV